MLDNEQYSFEKYNPGMNIFIQFFKKLQTQEYLITGLLACISLSEVKPKSETSYIYPFN